MADLPDLINMQSLTPNTIGGEEPIPLRGAGTFTGFQPQAPAALSGGGGVSVTDPATINRYLQMLQEQQLANAPTNATIQNLSNTGIPGAGIPLTSAGTPSKADLRKAETQRFFGQFAVSNEDLAPIYRRPANLVKAISDKGLVEGLRQRFFENTAEPGFRGDLLRNAKIAIDGPENFYARQDRFLNGNVGEDAGLDDPLVGTDSVLRKGIVGYDDSGDAVFAPGTDPKKKAKVIQDEAILKSATTANNKLAAEQVSTPAPTRDPRDLGNGMYLLYSNAEVKRANEARQLQQQEPDEDQINQDRARRPVSRTIGNPLWGINKR